MKKYFNLMSCIAILSLWTVMPHNCVQDYIGLIALTVNAFVLGLQLGAGL